MSERRRYVGAYGKKHHSAMVPGVGNLYNLEIVEIDHEAGVIRLSRPNDKPVPITPEAISILMGDEFASVDADCTYKLANGQYCTAKRSKNSEYCELHTMLAVLGSDVPSPSSAMQTPPPEFASDPALAAEPQSIQYPASSSIGDIWQEQSLPHLTTGDKTETMPPDQDA